MGQWKMVGRLYVYERQYGRYGWCSGTAVASHNESVVWTAGHCVKDSKWYSNMLFVPAQNGPKSHPFGRWPISELYTNTTWARRSACGDNCQWGSDYAAAVAYRRANGTSLEDVVGSLGMWFGAGLTNRTVLALGYPAGAPYFDKYEGYLFYCYNPVTRYEADGFGTYTWDLPCNMTGGSSGGPWLTQSGSRWYLVSNTSWGDGDDKTVPNTVLGGPYFDPTKARSFYNYVQSGSSDKECVVPRLRGRRLAGAKRALRRTHCWLGRVRHASSTVPRGHVISQRTVLSTGRTHGSNAVGIFVFTNVNLVVSSGRR
jgi:V8-like Glu-specific endopeptidase